MGGGGGGGGGGQTDRQREGSETETVWGRGGGGQRYRERRRRNCSVSKATDTTLQFTLRPYLSKVCLLVGCLTSQQHASVSQGRICSDNFTCCHTQIEVADPTFYLTQSQYTDTGPTSPSADPITPGAWQGNHWSANFLSH